MADRAIAQHHMFNVAAEEALAQIDLRGRTGFSDWLATKTGRAYLGNLMEAALGRSLSRTASGLYLPIPKRGPLGRFISVADFEHTGSGTGRPFIDVFSLNPRNLTRHANRWYGRQTDPVVYTSPDSLQIRQTSRYGGTTDKF
jgi:hypothetical protein